MNPVILLIVLLCGCVGCTKKEVQDMPPYQPSTFTACKTAAIFDITQLNGDANDNDRQLYSARHLMLVAGIPYFETQTMDEALKSSLLLFSSPILPTTFTVEQIATLKAWVANGGVIIASTSTSSAACALFGITATTHSKTRYRLNWTAPYTDELAYFDQDQEKSMSLGNSKYASVIKSYAFTLGDGMAMATYDTGEVGVVKNSVGKGCTYLLGIEWRDIIQRCQLNKDFDAQREGFEPSSDLFSFFVRSVFNVVNQQNVGISAWKYTLPEGYKTVLIPSHDIDSKTGMDEMYFMSQYEQELGLKAQYFITTHYLRDALMSAFYNEETLLKLKEVCLNGHRIGSHSVGHFPDFFDPIIFPMGSPTTPQEYQPSYSTVDQKSHDCSVMGEVGVSKYLLDRDLGTVVNSFRSGHLYVNKSLPEALQQSGYLYNSSFMARDLLTEFPFFERMGYTWEGNLSDVLEIPVQISDVYSAEEMTSENYPQKVALWKAEMDCLAANYAPCLLLVHPNRKWKMEAVKMLVNTLNQSEYGLYNFEDYGRFWRNRIGFNFSFEYIAAQGIVIVQASKADITRNKSLAIAIEHPHPIKQYVLIDEDLQVHGVRRVELSATRTLLVI